MTTFTNALSSFAHAGTRAIQEGRASTMKRMGNWAIKNPLTAYGAGGAIAGGLAGAMSDNSSFLGGAAQGAAFGVGGRFGWQNRGGIMAGFNTLRNKGMSTSMKDMKSSFSAGNRNLAIREALKDGRFQRLNRG